jgi:hypothetical protein
MMDFFTNIRSILIAPVNISRFLKGFADLHLEEELKTCM